MTATEQRSGGTPAVSSAEDAKPAGFRPDVQALRAIAVLAVVLNHLWPTRLTGGYVGVDIFFVISGFLISSHLDREILRTRRVRLGRFYARRVRRLLPAAFLVLVFSVVAAYFVLPYPRWAATGQEAIASATYWENWLLAAHSVEYSNLTAAASLEQHFWSLSVEEQFYLVWPLLLVLLFVIRRRFTQFVGIAVVGGASLAFSIYFTSVSRAQAYFVTPGRAWEFAIGALIALCGTKLVLPRWANAVLSVAGLAMIASSALLFNHLTEFPGYLALIPTAGTGMIIVAGTRPGRQWHTVLSSSPPVQFLGNISYSLYLWHWPLVVLAPFVLSDALVNGMVTTPQRLGIMAVAIVLAALSKTFVEDRGRTWSPLAGSTKLTFTAMAAGMIAVAVVAGGLTWTYDRHVAQAQRELQADAADPCYGAAALVPGKPCADPYGPAKVVNMGPANEYWHIPTDCGAPLAQFNLDIGSTSWACDYSRGAASPQLVWLIGDSHAEQWIGPMVDLARQRKQILKISVLGGCPFAKIQSAGYEGNHDPVFLRRCTNWRALVADAITHDRPNFVVTAFFARQEPADDHTGRSQTEQYRDGLMPYWNAWTAAGAQVIDLVDPPLNGDVRSQDCVVLNPTNPLACAVDRARAQPPDPLTEVARTSGNPHVRVVDLTNYFCDRQRCYAVIGHVAVYYDANHVNLIYSHTLTPMIAAALGWT
ncbi:MAG TPA: acyltransferase family protein [Pseudonocardiaceae bacterium]